MLLLKEDALEDRRRVVQGPLAPLLTSLVAELEPLIGRDPALPAQKALLSKVGGRCERDGSMLEFDPFDRAQHRCASCGTTYSGELHERAWHTWYHLWLAERAVHGALFARLNGDPRHAQIARDILGAYSEQYLTYPNRDNVLGPSRPFFSTYLESIWLLQVCTAADLLGRAGDTATASAVREKVVEPSMELIASFDEGHSNRQVWNNAALLAAALFLNERRVAERVLSAPSGVEAHLTQALLPDGTWFEGDNYHQFAIRGLWYCVTLCDANDLVVSKRATHAFANGIAGTFASALPDFTFPSRKDSQYAVSLRQWRFAELAELGLARSADERLIHALASCYEAGHERGDTGRARSTADAERNRPSSQLTRADLGWRALLHAPAELPQLRAGAPRSVHLTGQGLAVFRRPGGVYAALDYGAGGGGHGHPDRLNLLLFQGPTRWLDDLGTGSYVDPSLHWYRSSLAHNAPFPLGRSQQPGDGRLVAHAEDGDFGWVEAEFSDSGYVFRRTLVACRGYLIDELRVDVAEAVRRHFDLDDDAPFYSALVDLPFHLDADAPGVEWEPAEVRGGTRPEDGFSFCQSWARAGIASVSRLTARNANRSLAVTHCVSDSAVILRSNGPAQPATRNAPFYMVRFQGMGRTCVIRSVLAWDVEVDRPTFDSESVRVTVGGVEHRHSRSDAGWRVEVTGDEKRELVLAGHVAAPRTIPAPDELPRRVRRPWPTTRGTLTIELGKENYRPTEETWEEAGAPTASIAITASAAEVSFIIFVKAPNQRFAPATARNVYDNEHPDTMGAGVQLYVGGDGGRAMWMLVPETGSDAVRIRELPGSLWTARVAATWSPRPDGWMMTVRVAPPPTRRYAIDIVINDAVQGRERRRGQLVSHDAAGEFAYIRGDREDDSRSIHIDLE